MPRLLPTHRRHGRRRRRGDGAAGRAAHRGDRGRPAGLARGAGLRRGRAGEADVRHRRRCSTRCSRRRPRSRRAARRRLLPDRRAAARRRASPGGSRRCVLTAGSCVEWLRDDLGLVDDAARRRRARRVGRTTPPASRFVPALLGLGTPDWDFGARGGFFGLTRGATRAHLVPRGARGHRPARARPRRGRGELDGVDAVPALRVDGGMTANATFVQLLADVTGREVASPPCARRRRAGPACSRPRGRPPARRGCDRCDVAPSRTVEPAADDARREARRADWLARQGAGARTIPELSSISFPSWTRVADRDRRLTRKSRAPR